MEVELTCTGHRLSVKNKLLVCYTNRADGTKLSFFKKRGMAGAIGGVYKAETDDGMSFTRPQFDRHGDSSDAEVAEWTVRTKAAEAEFAMIKKEAELKKENVLEELLLPLRVARAKTNHNGQVAIDAIVLKVLRKVPYGS